MSGLSVGIVGATGAVGREFLGIFSRRSFPMATLRLFASERSAGALIPFDGRDHYVEALADGCFDGLDVVFFSAGAPRSREWAPKAVGSGAIVIDNSSAFRMDSDIPLVIPEINADAILPQHKIVSVPNCSAIVLLMAVAPLRSLGKIERMIVSTYQSASGAGAAAMDELVEQTRTVLDGGVAVPKVFPHPYAFNLFSHNTAIDGSGYNEEERKVIAESQKILDDPHLRIAVTCVRVPVLRAHSESIIVEFAGQRPSVDAVRAALAAAPGVRVVDDRDANHFPMPLEASGIDEVLVGRIREDSSSPNGICLFASGDQLLKGAALDAVQIAESMIARGLIGTRSSSAAG